jgi:hypothetical protein
LYLLCAPDGMPVYFALAPANEGEREVAAAMLEQARKEGLLRGGEIILAEEGFAGRASRASAPCRRSYGDGGG